MHIREQIQRIAGTFGIDLVQKLTCTVQSVSMEDRSCLVTPINSSIGQVKAYLMAETDDGILIVPSVNSTVKVLYSRLNTATVIQYSAIDSMLLIMGDITFSLQNGKAVLQQDKMTITLSNGLANISNGSTSFLTIMQHILNHILALTVSTGTGPSSVPVNSSDFTTDLNDLTEIFY